MHSFLLSPAVILLSMSLLFSGCQSTGSRPGNARVVPVGATTARAAAERFFAAYKAHNRNAAKEVATDSAINRLNWDPSSGDNPTLQLADDTHIYYEGGSIEMHITSKAGGRWYVQSVTLRAD
jgi:hypothetical protein